MTIPPCLRSAPDGDDKDIVGDKEGETGDRQFEVAQIELPGAEPYDEDDYYDLDGGQNSFHCFRSLPRTHLSTHLFFNEFSSLRMFANKSITH